MSDILRRGLPPLLAVVAGAGLGTLAMAETDPASLELQTRFDPIGAEVHATKHGERAVYFIDEGPRDGQPLLLAEVRLAGVDEDLRDRAPLGQFDERVGVDDRHAQPLGDEGPDGRLAGSRRADDDDVPRPGPRHHERIPSGIASR